MPNFFLDQRGRLKIATARREKADLLTNNARLSQTAEKIS